MKTLKKTLCLVLAMVMVFGLCVTSASAKLDAYTDKDDITYAEAVDVMTGIGVLAGDARGFRPTDTITRAEAAKIISYLLIGNATQADALKTTSDPFSDVPASHWAAGYIAYCAQRGIIAGMGDGYHPSDNVTGLQFAKMLLCALGYGVNDEYVGADWAINVSKDALTEGIALFKGNLAGANNNPATREECALYAFNALTVEKVSYSALLGGYITTSQSWANSANANEENTIAGDFKLDKAEDDEDAFMRPTGHFWYVDRASNVISATYGDPKDTIADPEDLQAKYTTTVKYSELFNAIGGKNFVSGLEDNNSTIEVYVDGNKETSLITKDDLDKNNTDDIANTGKGVETYVYTWSTREETEGNKVRTVNNLRVVIINTYLAKVTDVTPGTATKDPSTRVDILDSKTANKYDTVESGIKKGFNTEEFNENDYVLITAAKVGSDYVIQSMTAPVVKEIEVSRFSKVKGDISITADGTVYEAAENDAKDAAKDIASSQEIEKTIVDGEPRVLYIDNNGYLIAVGGVKTDSDYVYVAQFGWKIDTSSSLSDKSNLVADIYYADGTHKIVPVNNTDQKIKLKINNVEAEVDNELYDKGKTEDAVKTLNAIKDAEADKGAHDSTNMTGIYKLTMKSGKAILTNAATDNDVDGTTKSVTKGISAVYNKNGAIADKSANNKTVFFYVANEVVQDATTKKWSSNYDKDGYSVTAYTGVNSIPVAKKQEAVATAYILADAPNAAKFAAVLVKSNFEGDSSDSVYFYTAGNFHKDFDEANKNYSVEYTVYENGEPTKISYTYKDKDAANEAVRAAEEDFDGKFFTVKNNEKHTFEPVSTKKNSCYYDSGKTISTVDDTTVTLDSALTVTGADPATTDLCNYSGMKVIDVTDGDVLGDYVVSANNLKKCVVDGIMLDDVLKTCSFTVAIQCEANASQTILYMYITGVTATNK